jgi:hypothetical protein
MSAHGDAMSQWRLAQIARAIAALDAGRHRQALSLVERACLPADRISGAERAAAAALEQRLEIEQLLAALALRRSGR